MFTVLPENDSQILYRAF